MDSAEDCVDRVRRPNNDMSDGDVFLVQSDTGKASNKDQRQPAECSLGFNFGDRLLSVQIQDWWCDQIYTEPFLAIYDDCEGQRRALLVTAQRIVNSGE